MDLTPEKVEINCPECGEVGHLDCVRAAYKLGKRAGREDPASEINIDKIRRAVRRVCARIVASAPLLNVPFTDAPDQSPWTKAQLDMAVLYAAVGIDSFAAGWCSCPDCDITAFNEKPGSRTVKGLDPACPLHGSGITEGEG